MKKYLVPFAILSLAGNIMLAQGPSPDNADALNILVGGSFAKPKIMPAMDKLAIAQITVNYKLTTTSTHIGKEKSTGTIAGAKLTTYLETTDGELTEADFQEVTDYFYAYFQRKLKENGIDTVGWAKIASTEFYKENNEKLVTNEEEKKSGQVWVTHNANKGNVLYGGALAFAFGKIKQASRFSEEIGAPAGYFHITVDFADVLVNVDIKSKQSWAYPSGYTPLTRTTTFKYESAAKPDMKLVQSTLGNTMLWNEKSQAETITLARDIESGDTYHTSISQDPSRIKNRAFAFAKAMDPVVIETTRAQYKEAAKKALENYADAFVAKVKVLKSN